MSRPAANQAIPPVVASTAPAGTFASGTKIHVGGHKVVIDRYLSEGGFAHVYLVNLPRPIDGASTAVLKRVAVPDKESLANMRTEVETMKKLKGHRYIVTYIDSHASQLKGGGYEVFLLMEYCNGGGLIDFMNTRLQNRLTEPEILHIFSDVAEGVACMHYLKPPLLHRDLKVENVLITSAGSSRRYKLCDFGSTAPPRPAAATAAECRLIEDDVQKHTTLQYRSPEMIDVYRKQPIDEKSDIWALGVLLYKLCYYTTPFEEQGQLAILNASFKYPAFPQFSDRLKKLIASMLRENPQQRPNIYQVVRESCAMRGKEVPIKDIYAGRTHPEIRHSSRLPSPESTISSPSNIGAIRASPAAPTQIIPAIIPMRRGRPTAAQEQPRPTIKQSPSPLKGLSSDPFAVLDTKPANNPGVRSQDELSNRFPTLDQFSLLHESGGKFDFDQTSPVNPAAPKDLTQRVTEKLADDAFVQPATLPKSSPPKPSIAYRKPNPPSKGNLTAKIEASRSTATTLYQPSPVKPAMVSQGTMTIPSPNVVQPSSFSSTEGLDGRFSLSSGQGLPGQSRSPGLSRVPAQGTHRSDLAPSPRPGLTSSFRSKSQTNTHQPQSPASSRPSLEGTRPSSSDLNASFNRSRSANSRPRPSSAYLSSGVDYLRDREPSPNPASYAPSSSKRQSDGNRLTVTLTGELHPPEETNISSSVEFLRSMEESEGHKKKEKRSSSGSKSSKRSSLPSISLSGTKTLLAGRFGEAFRRFETNSSAPLVRSPSPDDIHARNNLTPIAGSVATGDTNSDDERLDISEEVSPEIRRELERTRLAQEESRVEAATAEHRKRIAARELGANNKDRAGYSGPSRASTIQNKVKTLLDENTKPISSSGGPAYVASADAMRASQRMQYEEQSRPATYGGSLGQSSQGNIPPVFDTRGYPAGDVVGGTITNNNIPGMVKARDAGRPNAPLKPQKLRTGGQTEAPGGSPPKPAFLSNRTAGPRAEGIPSVAALEEDFSKRFPSLSGLEMVETKIGRSQSPGNRLREPLG